MKVPWTLETGKCGCDLVGEIEIEDDASDDEIDTAVREDMWDTLSLTWSKSA